MSVTPEIYFDNAATTRPWPAAVAAVGAMLGDGYGNASSLHRRGTAAARATSGQGRVVAALSR